MSTEKEMVLISCRIYKSTFETFKKFYPLGYNKVIRALCARHAVKLEERLSRNEPDRRSPTDDS